MRGRDVRLSELAMLALVAALLVQPARGQDKKPALPPGRDPGGLAVALLSSGVDYTLADLAQRLARDGEGELIGWDFADNDRRPFERSGQSTPVAQGGNATMLALKIAGTGRRVIPVRIPLGAPLVLAQAVAFIARTPAKITAVPMWTSNAADWWAFGQAASHAPDLLFIIAAGDEGKDIDAEPVYPAALHLPNALVVTAAMSDASLLLRPQSNWGAKTVDVMVPASTSVEAIAVATIAAVSLLAVEPALGGASLKRILIERSALHPRDGDASTKTQSGALLRPAAINTK
jgi:hypothetical protein